MNSSAPFNKHPLLLRCLHWINALLIIALFVSGWIMVDLDYYSPWYNRLPEWHITGGVLLLLLWTLMILRTLFPKQALPDLQHHRLEYWLSLITQILFYLLVLIITVCGYLFTTADGQSKALLGGLNIPAISHFSAEQIDTMGWLHENLSYVLMGLVLLHVLGALKHHFIDRDATLKRML
ncbi:cytochrome b [Marinicella meishanensis]|uniref:cytochrome b n=1 Tax=Marinicella meishanensis TaxID=2873263 RepID=UPI001CBB6417|nr:cytochrome b/b6 domain-containing protein [Marinicella sp. NBU2979]